MSVGWKKRKAEPLVNNTVTIDLTAALDIDKERSSERVYVQNLHHSVLTSATIQFCIDLAICAPD